MDNKLHILHLEDEPDDVELVRDVLSATGLACEIECVATRAKFVAALERGNVDLVLSDFALRGFDGLSALAILRERAPDLPFIFVSGTLGEEAAIQGVRSGATDYVFKHRLSGLEPAVRRAQSEAEERRRRRQAEEALVQERGFLKALLENLDAGIVACDTRGVLTLVNQATREIYGLPQFPLPAEQWAAHYDLYFGKTSMAKEQAPLFRVLQGERLRNVEMTVIPHSGTPRQILASGQPIVDVHGQRLGAVIALNDVTERKQLEEQYRQSQKLESVGRLAAGVAHEINTPVQFVGDSLHFLCDATKELFGVLEKLQTVRRSVTEGTPSLQAAAEAAEAEEAADLPYLVENMPAALDRAVEGLGRVATIVRSMKEFAHPDAKEMTTIDLNRAIESTLTIARNEYKYIADVETAFSELPPVLCHPGDVNQAILNIIVNAAHAISDMVQGTEQRGRISVQTRVEGNDVVITIADTGGGIPEHIRAQIFDPFFTTKEVGKGTGQGLAIARSVVVDKHHGTLSLETEVGKGTTFFIRLPIDGADALAEALQVTP